MKSDLIYIEDFLTPDDADELFAFIQTQENYRPPNGHWGSDKRRHNYPGYSVNPTSHGGYPTTPKCRRRSNAL
jgi:hypothetical protein